MRHLFHTLSKWLLPSSHSLPSANFSRSFGASYYARCRNAHFYLVLVVGSNQHFNYDEREVLVLTFNKRFEFVLVASPRPETVFGSGEPKLTEAGEPIIGYRVLAMGAGRPPEIKVRVPGEVATVSVGEKVSFEGLEGRLYQLPDDRGTVQRISFSATKVGKVG